MFQDATRNRATNGIDPIVVFAEATAPPKLDEFCASERIKVVRFQPSRREDFDRELSTAIAAESLDLICLTFDRILPREIVHANARKIINVHMGLLPAFRGMRALQQAVETGARFAGATIHEVDEEVDHGPIIAQCVTGVRIDDTAETLGSRIYPMLSDMFAQVLRWYSSGRVTHDKSGRIVVRDARYGELPISPAVEPP